MIAVLLFALYGLYEAFLNLQYQLYENKVSKIEKDRKIDPILLYNKELGEPLFLINPNYKSTFFFMEGFKACTPAGMYKHWLNELHTKYKVNVIVPVYGLQSWPFQQRNREWYHQEDMRTILQIYEAYTSQIPKTHKLVVASMSFGTLGNLTIAARAKRKANKVILMSPLNSGMEFRAAGEIVYWLSKQTSWLQHIIIFSDAGIPPNRKSVWDIVNAEKNIKIASQNIYNPENNSRHGYQVELIAKWMEETIVPKVEGMDILVSWGNNDLFFSQKGFEELSQKLKKAGNRVETLTLKNSGHMVLMDNAEKQLKSRILQELGVQNKNE